MQGKKLEITRVEGGFIYEVFGKNGSAVKRGVSAGLNASTSFIKSLLKLLEVQHYEKVEAVELGQEEVERLPK